MRVSRRLNLILCVLVLINIVCGTAVLYVQHQNRVAEKQVVSENKEPQLLWMTQRKMPDDIDIGSYLAASVAVQDQQWELAADKYLKVWAADPDNHALGKEAYLLNAILGRFDLLEGLAQTLNKVPQPALLTDYVLAGYAAKKQDWDHVRFVLQQKKSHPIDEFLKPLLIAWSFAAEKNKEAAYLALDSLQSNAELSPYYAYHKGLIALVLNDESVAKQSFELLGNRPLLIMSYLPEIQAFFAVRNEWNLNNPVYVQAQLLQAKQPATMELMRLAPVHNITPLEGVAESIYNVSTALGGGQSAQETALLLNALSLYLRPKALLPLVWGGELLDVMGKSDIASYYYDQLGASTPTLRFKFALNLIRRKQLKKALVVLDQLKATNQTNVSLWLLLGGLYMDLEQWRLAQKAYTHLISIDEFQQMAKDKQADVYFARSFLYDKTNESALAEADLQRALDLDPDNAMVLNHLGYRWIEQNTHREQGFELVKKAYQLKPADPYILDSMAYGYYCEGDYEKAVSLAEQSVDLMPQSSVSNAHLGDIYAALGRKREAGFQYYKALSMKADLTPELERELTKKIAQK